MPFDMVGDEPVLELAEVGELEDRVDHAGVRRGTRNASAKNSRYSRTVIRS